LKNKQSDTSVKSRSNTRVSRSSTTGSGVATFFKVNPQKSQLHKKIRKNSPLHRRIVLHPAAIFTLLCVGVFISGWSYEAVADNYTVTAVVPAQSLAQGAVITSPTAQTTVTTATLQVSGTCPSGAYVKLYTNNTFSGVTFCENDGTFSLDDDLYLGQNNLIAEDFNVTNQQGPTTSTVTVDYVPPTPPSSISSTGSSDVSTGSSTLTQSTPVPSDDTITPGLTSVAPSTTVSAAPTLLLTSNYQYQTSPVTSDFTWEVDVQGGNPPYQVNIAWGDGTTSNLVFNTDPIFKIKHHYAAQGYYAIKVKAVDKTGIVRFIQLAARIVRPNTTGNLSTTNTNYSLPIINHKATVKIFSASKSWLWLAWPSFVIVLIMLISFWLGERQEVHKLYKKRRHASVRT
jgi:hypothetical protein